jgi:hypothetical protein
MRRLDRPAEQAAHCVEEIPRLRRRGSTRRSEPPTTFNFCCIVSPSLLALSAKWRNRNEKSRPRFCL